MDNLIDLVRSLLSLGVVEDSMRSLNENRERVTRALFGVVPAVIARWAIDLQSALEEERLADRLQLVKGLSSNLQSQDWVVQLSHEILASDYPEETAQRIFGDAPIDDLFLEATAQYLRVPERLIKVLAPLVDGICLVTISLKLDPDSSNRRELFEYIKAQQQFIPVNMMSMLAGQDVLTAPANGMMGRIAYPNHLARPSVLRSDNCSSLSSVDNSLNTGSKDDYPESQGGVSGQLQEGAATSESIGRDDIGSSASVFVDEADKGSNGGAAISSNTQLFSGGEIRWVVDDEPKGGLPGFIASCRRQLASSSSNYKGAKVVGGVAIALVLATTLWSGILSGGGQGEGTSTYSQLQLAEQGRIPVPLEESERNRRDSSNLSGIKTGIKVDPEVGEDEDTRAMLAAVRQAGAELEANPGKKVMSQPLVKNDIRKVVKAGQKNLEADAGQGTISELPSDESSVKGAGGKSSASEQNISLPQKNLSQAAVKYNDAIAPEDLEKIADRLNSKVSSGGLRNGSSFLLNGISFERSTSKLERAAIAPLKVLAKILIDNPDLNLKIIGHSDNSGRADKNQKLSVVRAWSVESQLRDLGVVGARIRSEGKGSAEPLVSNNTEEGREQNRRIEFVLYRARD